ncbi:MAG: hypothetical protein F4Y02_16165 [Chloroflexi bacterium]|nr:hypothetical protein [Chloroflexota bacterium]
MQTHTRILGGMAAALGTALVLAACGGGGSGGGSPTAQPMEPDPPMVMPEPDPIVSFTRSNPTGQDLLDHWNQQDAAQTALGLTTGNVALGAIRSLIRGADDIDERSRAVMRNAGSSRITTIGHDNGITYGTWQDGPAGTLNMQLDWSQASSLSADRRGDFERAVKAWTYRLDEDFPARTVPAHEDYTYMLFEYDEPQTADDMLIVVELETWDGSPLAGGNYFEWSERNGDVESWFGHIQMSPEEREHYHNDFFRYMYVLTHELGHTLPPFGPRLDGHGGLAPDMGAFEEYLDIENGLFTGPNAMAANGGQPVPYQWIDDEHQPVPAGTPGATLDFGHIGPCDSIISYAQCSDHEREVLVKPTELDFAILKDIGYDLLPASEAAQPEVYGYGAWAEYSAWGAGVERIIGYHGSSDDFRITDRLSAHADAFGVAPGTDFADAHAGMTGSATWEGSLLGVDIGGAMLPPVFGDAAMTVDLADLDGTLAFSNLMTAVDGQLHDFRRSRLDYNIAVTGNGFGDSDGVVNGSFYGPEQEEMAGVVDDRSSGVNLIAGFGGTR